VHEDTMMASEPTLSSTQLAESASANDISSALSEAELPVVDDGQVQLSDLVSRVVQASYAEMTEMAET
jgi:hypothetical protein